MENYCVVWVESPNHLKVGIARNVTSGLMPINGLRHPPEGDTTGWYIWAGEIKATPGGKIAPRLPRVLSPFAVAAGGRRSRKHCCF